MDINTLEQVHRYLLDKVCDMDSEIEKYRTGTLVDDSMYGRLVYKQSGAMSQVLAVNDLMGEATKALKESR